MTTGNKIVTKTIDDVVYVPMESVQTGSDSIPFVYMKSGERQIVVAGESNENNIVVEQGLKQGDLIYLNTPEEPEKFTKLLGEELITIIKEKEKVRKEQENKANQNVQERPMGGRGGMRGTGEGRTMDTAAMRQIGRAHV